MTNQEARVWAYLLNNRQAGSKEVAINTDTTEDFVLSCMNRISSPNWRSSVRDRHVGTADYSERKIQPWDIWLEYRLNPWDADIIKRVLRNKPGQRRLDYEKIIHVCQERIRQIDEGQDEVKPHAGMAPEKSIDTQVA